MARNATPPEALDEKFVRILIEELMPPTSSFAGEGIGAASAGEPAEAGALSEAAAPEFSPAASSPSHARAGTLVRGQGEAGWQLRISEENGPEHFLVLGDRPVTIGRSRDNTVIVHCPRVSRKHVRIWLDETGPQVEDLGIRNRMRVNGVRMFKSHLQVNDTIQIGSVKVFVEHAGGDVSSSH